MKKLLPLVLSLAACSAPEPPPPAPRPVVVATVGEEAAGGLAVYAGEVRARHEADLAFRVGGKLVERRVNLGDRVAKGQVLARLDPADAKLAASAGAAQVAAAEAELALATAEYARARDLAARNFVSATAVDTRRTQWQAAAARLEQAKAQAGAAGNALAYTSLVADRAGVVTAAPGEPGQVVAAGQTVLRLADPGEREVLIYVPEARIGAIRPGQPASVRPWAAALTSLAARVREVAASADAATRTFAVRVAVAGEALPLGSSAAVVFAGEAGGVSLPLAAVIARDGRAQVWVVGADGKLAPRAVETAAFDDERVVIKSGLAAGERVVVVGAHTLAAGMTVRPLEAKAPLALDLKR